MSPCLQPGNNRTDETVGSGMETVERWSQKRRDGRLLPSMSVSVIIFIPTINILYILDFTNAGEQSTVVCFTTARRVSANWNNISHTALMYIKRWSSVEYSKLRQDLLEFLLHFSIHWADGTQGIVNHCDQTHFRENMGFTSDILTGSDGCWSSVGLVIKLAQTPNSRTIMS